MTAEEPEAAVALLVVRAWREGPGPDGLRARIWSSQRLPDQPLRVRVVGSAEEIDEAVSTWLEQLRLG